MPLYEYQCDACGHRFEVIVKYSDPPLEKCPVCGGHVHKLVSSPAFQFKGTGWYVTDYAKKDHVPGGKTGDSSSESGGKDKSDGGDKKDSEKSGTGEKADKSGKESSTSESSSSSAAGPSTSASSTSGSDTGTKSGGTKSGSS